jgi:hypothetical protein
MLQAPLGDAALEYRALTARGPAQLIAAATAGILLVGIAYGAIASADSRQSAGEAVTAALTVGGVSFAGFCGHRNRYGG